MHFFVFFFAFIVHFVVHKKAQMIFKLRSQNVSTIFIHENEKPSDYPVCSPGIQLTQQTGTGSVTVICCHSGQAKHSAGMSVLG